MPGPFRGALRGLVSTGGSVQPMVGSMKWIYVAVILVLLVIAAALVVLTIREYYLLKKKKKE